MVREKFIPVVCDCSYATVRHVVTTRAAWIRHEARKDAQITQERLHLSASGQREQHLGDTVVGEQNTSQSKKRKRRKWKRVSAPTVSNNDSSDGEPLPLLLRPLDEADDYNEGNSCGEHHEAGNSDAPSVSPNTGTDITGPERLKHLTPERNLQSGETEPEAMSISAHDCDSASDGQLINEQSLQQLSQPLAKQIGGDNLPSYIQQWQREIPMPDTPGPNEERTGQMSQGFASEAEYEADDILDKDLEINRLREELQEETTESSSDGAPPFNYRNPAPPDLSKKEVLSFSLHNSYTRFQTQRRCYQDIHEILGALYEQPLDERTTEARIQRYTGIQGVRYDCCIQSCMSFAMYPDMQECKYCQHPRFKTLQVRRQKGKKPTVQKPWATYDYIPVTHRMRLWWADTRRAQVMLNYRRQVKLDRENGMFSDFWSGGFCAELQQQGLLQHDTDIAFFFSSDAVKVFKSRRSFKITPLLLASNRKPSHC
ncbi:hypothetical protein EDC01DRAFT_636530 [Geopyxis carbonaria]|nr:hypothetical protein EDC01DRAFT_636530 [Geopyxis carbonaria]